MNDFFYNNDTSNYKKIFSTDKRQKRKRIKNEYSKKSKYGEID